jgi:ATP synthase protein I
MAAGDPDDPRKGTEEERFQEEVRRKAERRMRSRSRQDEGVWHWLGMFGLVGWAVAIPTLLGVAAGVWLDRHWGGEISWTLSLLFVGVAVGCLHAWYWIRQERQRD